MKNKLLKFIIFTGIWIYPIAFAVIWIIFNALIKMFNHNTTMSKELFNSIFIVALVPVGIIFFLNLMNYISGDRIDFSPEGYFKPEKTSPKKRRSMYPKIGNEYLSSKPEGLILGKYHNKYVRIPNNPFKVMHTCIIGPPGSGKSSGPLISTLLANYIDENPTSVFAIDIKPELAKKSVLKNIHNVHVINPSDRSSYGWYIYGFIDHDASDDEILDKLEIIAESLITGDPTSPEFFIFSARILLCGFLLYYYRNHTDFIDAVRLIIEKDVSQHISEILSDTSRCRPGSRVYAILNKYKDIEGDAFDNITMYLQNPLQVFLWDDIKYMFGANRKKTEPRMLDEGNSIFLSFPESSLKNYRSILNMITAQVLDYLQGRPESRHDKPIYLMIDEFARIGRLSCITDSLATLRSRGVSIILAVQDLSQLRTIYSRDETLSIFNLCKVLCILDCQDIETCRHLSELAGTYEDTSSSFSCGQPGHGMQTRYSTVTRNIIDVSDVMTLSKKDEAIIFIEGQYYRINKAFYPEDPVLGPLAKVIAEKNGLT